MKNLFILLITTFCFLGLNAQDQKYIDEAVALVKIKSFSPSTDSKKCDVYAYVRAGNHSKKATYYVELKVKGTNEIVFRDLLDFNNINGMQVAKSHRKKDDVYELFFGMWVITEDTYMQLVILEPNGSQITYPVEFTNYKNPITIMN